ncbi:hypothetical protein KCU67_g10527, partial [Aureobasidium melanogenum]
TDALRSTHLVISLVPDIKDEFSRLRIWGEQTYAVLPQNARRSLDEQLREDEDTKNVVIRCLRRLNSHIEKAIEQTNRFLPTADVDTEDEEYSSLSDESDTAQDNTRPDWEIRFNKTIEVISEGIRSLYRVSVLLRRPRNSSKYLKSSSSTIPSHDTLRVTLDYAHVSEKIRQWRHLTMRSRVGGDEEHVVTEEEMQLRQENEQQEIADIAFFCQRLAWANLFRRKQFDYWVDHPDVPETQIKALDAVVKTDQRKDKIMSAIPTSLSTVAKSALGDNAEVGQWRTEIALFVLPMDPDGDEDDQVKEIAEERSEHAEDVNSNFTKRKLEEDVGKTPIRFTDVLGREYILPWTTMKTWTSLENILVSAFLDIERIRPYVMNGNYRLIGPSDDVILPKDWESLVQPGWEVQMQLWPVTETSEEDIASSLGVATEWNRQGLRARSPVLQPEAEPVVKSCIPPIDNEVNEVKEDNGSIVCICGTRHEAGLKLQCNTCKSWQHGICYYATEADRPDERDIVC